MGLDSTSTFWRKVWAVSFKIKNHFLVIASLQNALGEVRIGNKAGYGDEPSSDDED